MSLIQRKVACSPAPRDTFSSLPREIRDIIYKMLFLQKPTVLPFEGVCHANYAQLRNAIGLSTTSRMIHSETMRFFYGGNDFLLQSYEVGKAVRWLDSIGVLNRSFLRKVRIDTVSGISDHTARVKSFAVHLTKRLRV